MIKCFEYLLYVLYAITFILLFSKYRSISYTLSYISTAILILICILKIYSNYKKDDKINISKSSLAVMFVLTLIIILFLVFG